MVEIILEGLAKGREEATIQQWFVEEGDAVNEGDDLVELVTEDGVSIIHSPVTGIVAEVYYDEGEIVAKGEVVCVVDEEGSDSKEKDEDSEEDEEEDDSDEDDDAAADDEDEEEDGDDDDFEDEDDDEEKDEEE